MVANAAPGVIRSWRRRHLALQQTAMNVRLRKLIGSIALVVYSLVYYAFAISVALARLPDLPTYWHILFYFVTVVIWFVPAAIIVRWIQVGRAMPGG
ncbi:MAG: DUF2842 domain-containing protein [Rhodomicrobium sp.]|nr:DUF2842 domain-containing protein [Rhodomicrobium sp.]